MTTPLPPASSFTSSTTTETGFKTAVTSLISFLQGLLGTSGLAIDARTALGLAGASISYNDRGAWNTSTTYLVNDLVVEASVVYVCQTAHTSGTFATDLAAGDWTIHQGATLEQLAASSGSSLVGYLAAGTGAVATDVQTKLREVRSAKGFGAVGDGVADDTAALVNYAAALPDEGALGLEDGKVYRITDTLTLLCRHIVCAGKATILVDINDLAKDGISLSAKVIRNGSAQAYYPAGRLEGVVVLVKSNLRDGIRLNGGDHPVWSRVDVQRDVTTSPTWRDGVHVESGGDQQWIENLALNSVRVGDAGRDGFRFEVPAAAWTNTFINVGNYLNCEVRGSGLCEPGLPVHFVSNSTDANNKISQHNFIGGEYQTNNTATNPNPDGFKATKAGGAAAIESINIVGATAECVPTSGTGLAVNTTNMERVTLTNFLPYQFTGASSGVGGTGDYIVFGYLGLDAYTAHGEWTVGLAGATTPGTPTVSFQKGVYSRVGKLIHVSFQIAITNWGTAAGNLTITGLPFTVKNDAFARSTGVPWDLNNITFGAGYSQIVLTTVENTKTIRMAKLGSGVNYAFVQVSEASTPFEIAGSLTYYTD